MGTTSITNSKFQKITTTFQNLFTKLKNLNFLGILLQILEVDKFKVFVKT